MKPLKFKLPFLALAITTLFLVTGCRNPINAKNGQRYYDAGFVAEKSGDLMQARILFSRALANAQMGNLGPRAEAYSLYEWSRVTGYLGKYQEAEKGFEDVLGLIDKTNGDPEAENLRAPALSELSRLLHDTQQHTRAVPYFAQASVALEKRNVEKSDPLGFVEFLETYADSSRAAGFGDLADIIKRKADRIKAENPHAVRKFKPRHYTNR